MLGVVLFIFVLSIVQSEYDFVPLYDMPPPFAPAPPNTTVMKVVNTAGAPVDVFWVKPGTNKLVKQTPKSLRHNTDTLYHCVNNFIGNQFLVRFREHVDGVETSWKKLHLDERVIIKYDHVSNQLVNHQVTKLDEVKSVVAAAASSCAGTSNESCVASQVIAEIFKMEDKFEERLYFRDRMVNQLMKYICSYPAPKYSPAMQQSAMNVSKEMILGSNRYMTETYLDLPQSKLLLVKDLISREQCDHLLHHMRPAGLLDDDVVAAIKSGLRRPASYLYDIDDRVRPILRTAKDLIASVSGISVEIQDQEPLHIQSFKVGAYQALHCNGHCTGAPFQSGARVASIIMHCTEPVKGGTLYFPNADLVLTPTRGSAVFIIYKDGAGHTDEGYTEHMSCPVVEGEKVAAVLHLREGVTVERPWKFLSSHSTTHTTMPYTTAVAA